MIKLEKMSEHDFNEYMNFVIPNYAQDISDNFSLPLDKAMEESEMMMKDLFPSGLTTEIQFLYNVLEQDLNQKIGTLWFDVSKEVKRAYLYHIYIDSSFRRKGYGTETLKILELTVKELGMSSLALSVFGSNELAFNLYKKLSYQTSSISMHKSI